MTEKNKIRVKIPHTKWSLSMNNDVYLMCVFFLPVMGLTLLTSVIGFQAICLVGIVVLSFMIVLGMDIVDDDINTSEN